MASDGRRCEMIMAGDVRQCEAMEGEMASNGR